MKSFREPLTEDEREVLNRLLSRMGDLKRESIGARLREYVSGVVERNRDLGDPTTMAKQVTKAYGVRSDLVHNGYAQGSAISESLTFLQDFVPRLLMALLGSAADPVHSVGNA